VWNTHHNGLVTARSWIEEAEYLSAEHRSRDNLTFPGENSSRSLGTMKDLRVFDLGKPPSQKAGAFGPTFPTTAAPMAGLGSGAPLRDAANSSDVFLSWWRRPAFTRPAGIHAFLAQGRC